MTHFCSTEMNQTFRLKALADDGQEKTFNSDLIKVIVTKTEPGIGTQLFKIRSHIFEIHEGVLSSSSQVLAKLISTDVFHKNSLYPFLWSLQKGRLAHEHVYSEFGHNIKFLVLEEVDPDAFAAFMLYAYRHTLYPFGSICFPIESVRGFLFASRFDIRDIEAFCMHTIFRCMRRLHKSIIRRRGVLKFSHPREIRELGRAIEIFVDEYHTVNDGDGFQDRGNIGKVFGWFTYFAYKHNNIFWHHAKVTWKVRTLMKTQRTYDCEFSLPKGFVCPHPRQVMECFVGDDDGLRIGPIKSDGLKKTSDETTPDSEKQQPIGGLKRKRQDNQDTNVNNKRTKLVGGLKRKGHDDQDICANERPKRVRFAIDNV